MLTMDTYFIYNSETQHVKIGRSENVKRRLANLQNANSARLKLIGTIPMDCEKEWHEEFKRYRGYGEWFLLVEPLLQALRERVNRRFEAPARKVRQQKVEQQQTVQTEAPALFTPVIFKQCSHCHKHLDITHFGVQLRQNLRSYRQSWCKRCIREYNQARRERVPIVHGGPVDTKTPVSC